MDMAFTCFFGPPSPFFLERSAFFVLMTLHNHFFFSPWKPPISVLSFPSEWLFFSLFLLSRRRGFPPSSRYLVPARRVWNKAFLPRLSAFHPGKAGKRPLFWAAIRTTLALRDSFSPAGGRLSPTCQPFRPFIEDSSGLYESRRSHAHNPPNVTSRRLSRNIVSSFFSSLNPLPPSLQEMQLMLCNLFFSFPPLGRS